MSIANEIATKLMIENGFAKIFTFFFFGPRKAKKSYEIYTTAEKKGVFDLTTLLTAEYEDNKYAIFAFAPSEKTISIEERQQLETLIKSVDIGTIRYESLSYGSLEEWRGEEGSCSYEAKEITGIAHNLSNILVFPVSGKTDCPYVIYAQKDGKHFIYPLTKKEAEAIIA